MDDFVAQFAHGFGRNLRGLKRSFDRRIGKTDHPRIVPYRGSSEIAEAGSRMVVVKTTDEAARDASAAGWLTAPKPRPD